MLGSARPREDLRYTLERVAALAENITEFQSVFFSLEGLKKSGVGNGEALAQNIPLKHNWPPGKQ